MARLSAQRAAVAAILALIVALGAGPAVAQAVESRPIERPGSLTPSQLLGGRTLTPLEAQAACGPAAAVAMARASGRQVSLDGAVSVAREVGWTAARGMPGPWGEVQLLKRLGVPATLEAGLSTARITREVQAGRPVIIRTSGVSATTPGHYFVAERYDAASGTFDLAQSALVLRSAAGKRWFSLNQIASLGTGVPTHVIYLVAGVTAPSSSATVAAMSVRTGAPVLRGTHVVQSGGPGGRLRAAAGTSARIVGVLADGSRVSVTGETTTVAGRLWRQVKTASGLVAWMDDGLLNPI
ncbi:MAG: SH3 domain-containing protein [Chloroflexota bacterium]